MACNSFREARKILRHRHIINPTFEYTYAERLAYEKRKWSHRREANRLKRCGVKDVRWDYPKEKFPKQFIHWLQRAYCKIRCRRARRCSCRPQQFREIHNDLRTDRDFQFFYKSYRIRMQFVENGKMNLWVGESNVTFDKWGNSTLAFLKDIEQPAFYHEFTAMLKQSVMGVN